MRLSVILIGLVLTAGALRVVVLREARPGAAAEIVATNPDLGQALVKLAALDDDAGKAKELERLAPFVFATIDSDLKSRYFEAVKSIRSDDELRGLLVEIAPYGSDPSVASEIRGAAESLPPEKQAEVFASL